MPTILWTFTILRHADGKPKKPKLTSLSARKTIKLYFIGIRLNTVIILEKTSLLFCLLKSSIGVFISKNKTIKCFFFNYGQLNRSSCLTKTPFIVPYSNRSFHTWDKMLCDGWFPFCKKKTSPYSVLF